MKNVFFIAGVFFLATNAFGQRTAGYISKGNEYYLRLQFDMAEEQYRKALEIEPGNAEARYNLANTLMQQKKYKAAIEEYDAVTSGNKNLKAASHYNAGVSYSKQKDLQSSIEAYKAALRVNPNDKEARENLQKGLSELKKQQDQNNQNNQGGGGMSEKQADQKLKDLQQKEKELQQLRSWLNAGRAVQPFGRLGHNGQPQARVPQVLPAKGVEQAENFLPVFLRNTHTIVANPNSHRVVARLRVDVEP